MSGIPSQSSLRSAAASGNLPSRTSNTEIVIRPCLFGQRADRIAPYKVIRQAGPHAVCAAPYVSRRATRHVEGPNVPHAIGKGGARPLPGPPGPSMLFIAKQRVEESHRGDASPIHRQRQCLAHERDSGRLAARRIRVNGRRLSAPTPGTSVPCPALKGAAYVGDAAWARGDLANSRRNQSGFPFGRPARLSFA